MHPNGIHDPIQSFQKHDQNSPVMKQSFNGDDREKNNNKTYISKNKKPLSNSTSFFQSR